MIVEYFSDSLPPSYFSPISFSEQSLHHAHFSITSAPSPNDVFLLVWWAKCWQLYIQWRQHLFCHAPSYFLAKVHPCKNILRLPYSSEKTSCCMLNIDRMLSQPFCVGNANFIFEHVAWFWEQCHVWKVFNVLPASFFLQGRRHKLVTLRIPLFTDYTSYCQNRFCPYAYDHWSHVYNQDCMHFLLIWYRDITKNQAQRIFDEKGCRLCNIVYILIMLSFSIAARRRTQKYFVHIFISCCGVYDRWLIVVIWFCMRDVLVVKKGKVVFVLYSDCLVHF